MRQLHRAGGSSASEAPGAVDSILEMRHLPADNLALSDFVADKPYDTVAPVHDESIAAGDELIHGIALCQLGRNVDQRGHLTELYSKRLVGQEALVHVYQVSARPGSVRAWVYHRHQRDRLCFTEGIFRLALYDLRPDSPTFQRLNVLKIGAANPVLIEIPPFVVHGVQNAGSEPASFINMPTAIWRQDAPDKRRIPYPDPRLPFTFD